MCNKKKKMATTMTRATRSSTKKIIVKKKDPALQHQDARRQPHHAAARAGTGDDKPPVAGRQDDTTAHQEAAAQTTKEPAAPDDGQRRRRAGTTAWWDINDPCSICGARSHTEYFCAYNYMHGCLSARSCAERCSPGRHAMAADSLRRFVRVTNVPASLSERGVRWLFERFGTLRACVIKRVGPDGGAGFGFVTFDDRGDAEAAVDELNGHRVGDRRLRVDCAYPRAGTTV